MYKRCTFEKLIQLLPLVICLQLVISTAYGVVTDIVALAVARHLYLPMSSAFTP